MKESFAAKMSRIIDSLGDKSSNNSLSFKETIEIIERPLPEADKNYEDQLLHAPSKKIFGVIV
jgi:hypothetical protein